MGAAVTVGFMTLSTFALLPEVSVKQIKVVAEISVSKLLPFLHSSPITQGLRALASHSRGIKT